MEANHPDERIEADPSWWVRVLHTEGDVPPGQSSILSQSQPLWKVPAERVDPERAQLAGLGGIIDRPGDELAALTVYGRDKLLVD